MRRVKQFIKDAVGAAIGNVKGFLRSLRDHTEAAAILGLSAMGLSALLEEVPFYIALPIFIEEALFIPVIATVLVLGLLKSAEFRAHRRALRMVVA